MAQVHGVVNRVDDVTVDAWDVVPQKNSNGNDLVCMLFNKNQIGSTIAASS